MNWAFAGILAGLGEAPELPMTAPTHAKLKVAAPMLPRRPERGA